MHAHRPRLAALSAAVARVRFAAAAAQVQLGAEAAWPLGRERLFDLSDDFAIHELDGLGVDGGARAREQVGLGKIEQRMREEWPDDRHKAAVHIAQLEKRRRAREKANGRRADGAVGVA